MGEVVVFASGSGSNFQALCESLSCSRHRVAGLICDQPGARVLERARELGVPAQTVRYAGAGEAPRRVAESEIRGILARWSPSLVALAGFMRILSAEFVRSSPVPIVNIHPSLLPAYRGMHAIERALAAGEARIGVTVHYVDEGVDTGTIIRQESVERKTGESRTKLEDRVHALEHRLYPDAVIGLLENSQIAGGLVS